MATVKFHLAVENDNESCAGLFLMQYERMNFGSGECSHNILVISQQKIKFHSSELVNVVKPCSDICPQEHQDYRR